MNRHKGFSLLEVLVAFAILSFSLAIILRVFASGVQSTVQAEDYSMAIEIADSLLARTGIEKPLQVGMMESGQIERFHWLVRVESGERQQRSGNTESSSPQSNPEVLWQLLNVRVEVSWGDDERHLVLQTLKLARVDQSQ